MTRGRPPLAAQENAKPIADKRGIVMHYRHEPGSLCDFSIMNPDRVAFVSVKRMRRLCCAIEELARQFAPEIAALRMIVLDGGPEGGFVWGVRTEGNRFSDMWDTMLRAIHPREQGLKLTIVNALLPCHEQGKTDHL